MAAFGENVLIKRLPFIRAFNRTSGLKKPSTNKTSSLLIKTKSTSQTPRKFKSAILLAITALALLASPRSHADAQCNSIATVDWINPGTGDWFDASNWLDVNGNHSLPVCVGPTYINNGGTAQISTTTQTAEACEFVLGALSSQSGNLIVDHGTLHTCNEMVVGHQGKGTVKITNADSSVTNTFGATIGEETGSYGSVNVDNHGNWTVGEGVYGVGIYVGGTNTHSGGTGLVSVTSGGSASAVSVYVWGSGTLTGNGTVVVNSGSGTATFDGTLAPNGGGGTLTFDGSLQLDGGAATQCKVTPQDPSTTPQVNVSKQLFLGGRLSVTMTGDFSSAPTRFTLLHADSVAVGHITFNSTSITYPTGQGCWVPQITYDYNGGHVSVYLDRVYTCN